MVALCQLKAAGIGAQEQDQVIEISSIELHPGQSAQMFMLRIRCSLAPEFTSFWVGGRTFVLDIRNAYTPFRGEAAREWSTIHVGAVRASQFMESPVPIARIEIDVLVDSGSMVRRTGNDLEVSFGPPGPAFPAAGGWNPLPGTTGAAALVTYQPVSPAAVDSSAAIQPEKPSAIEPVVPRTGGRENPFDPILKPTEDVDRTNTQIRPLPDAEILTLTGISFNAEKPEETLALLRDGQGANFRLKKGDRVLYGFVSAITAKEIVFSLDIYGRRKEVRLALPPNPLER